jgi:hypothetical protein
MKNIYYRIPHQKFKFLPEAIPRLNFFENLPNQFLDGTQINDQALSNFQRAFLLNLTQGIGI